MSRFREGEFDRGQLPYALRKFSPHRAVRRLGDLTPLELFESGKRLVMLDVDNTVLPWGRDEIPEETARWVREARAAGLEMCLISNTRHPKRLERIAGELQVKYFYGKFKPNPALYFRALEEFRVEAAAAVMVGDQIFTDVWGANRAGIDSIWLEPLTPRDFVGTKISRIGERILKRFLYRTIAEPMQESAPLSESTPKDRTQFHRLPIVRQFLKFSMVGGTSFLIDAGLHYLFMFKVPVGNAPMGTALGRALLDWNPSLFAFAAKPSDAAFPVLKFFTAGLAILNSFFWNRRWTFRIKGRDRALKQFHRFIWVTVSGMGLNLLISTLLNNVIAGHPNRSWAVATLVATAVVAFWNFSGQKFWAFRQEDPD